MCALWIAVSMRARTLWLAGCGCSRSGFYANSGSCGFGGLCDCEWRPGVPMSKNRLNRLHSVSLCALRWQLKWVKCVVLHTACVRSLQRIECVLAQNEEFTIKYYYILPRNRSVRICIPPLIHISTVAFICLTKIKYCSCVGLATVTRLVSYRMKLHIRKTIIIMKFGHIECG